VRVPDGVSIHVVDSTADYRWMVLPRRLAAIRREGDMAGRHVPSL
jgi:hypothetical protein